MYHLFSVYQSKKAEAPNLIAGDLCLYFFNIISVSELIAFLLFIPYLLYVCNTKSSSTTHPHSSAIKESKYGVSITLRDCLIVTNNKTVFSSRFH